MLSQIRQISDGNHNTVFVKNKEQKFNLDKEIHDLECWKQSRNHVYRKEERELLAHLDKLRHQQEYLHHLDEERGLHPRGVIPSTGGVERRHSRETRGQSNVDNISESSSPGRAELSVALNLQGPCDLSQHAPPPPSSSPSVSLPPVRSFTDKKALHRTDAYINICVMCQLPRRSATQHGYHVVGEAVCCCEHDGSVEPRGRRFTIADFEEHHGSRPPVIEVGQRRHSLMMARLNDKHEYKPHPPDRSHEGHSKGNHHTLDSAKGSIKDHNSHIHDSHGNIRHHHGHAQQHHHHGDIHHHHGDNHHYHGHDHHGNASHHHGHDHQGNSHHHHGHVHDHNGNHSGSPLHTFPHSTHAHNNQRHNHHGNHTDDVTHTPSNSPHRSSRHSISHLGHHNPHVSRHDPMYSVHHSVERTTTHGNHVTTDHVSSTRRTSDVALHLPGDLGTGSQDSNSDARRRDHELHWDRHQVCKLRGMITDPHYKEQLEVESGKSYPWSSQYQTKKTSSDGIEELKNCRYLRFSKLNLESMKENPEEEVEVFEKKEDTPS